MLGTGQGQQVKHYRVNKVTRPGGAVIKRKDILASSDAEAVKRAEADDDCPVCEVLHAGEVVGSVD